MCCFSSIYITSRTPFRHNPLFVFDVIHSIVVTYAFFAVDFLLRF